MKRPGGFDRGPEDDARAAAKTTPQYSAAPESVPAAEPHDAAVAAERPRVPLSDDVPVDPAAPEPAEVPELPKLPQPSGTHDEAVTLTDSDAETRELARFERNTEDPIRAAKRHLKRAQRSVRTRERREQRRFTAHVRRRRLNWMIVGGAVLVLALFVAIGVLSPLTAVREVEVVGAENVDVAAVEEALTRFEGTPLALVDQREVHRALEPFPLIQRYSVERIPPHTLRVQIQERDGVIAIPRGKKFDLFDPAGVQVDTVKSAPKGVPVATGRVKTISSPAFAAAAQVIRDMPHDIRKRLVGVSASSAQDVTFELSNGKQVVWGDVGETQRKAVVLRALLKAAKSATVFDVSAPEAPVFH